MLVMLSNAVFIMSISVIDWGPKDVRLYAHLSNNTDCYVQVPRKTIEIDNTGDLLYHLLGTECKKSDMTLDLKNRE